MPCYKTPSLWYYYQARDLSEMSVLLPSSFLCRAAVSSQLVIFLQKIFLSFFFFFLQKIPFLQIELKNSILLKSFGFLEGKYKIFFVWGQFNWKSVFSLTLVRKYKREEKNMKTRFWRRVYFDHSWWKLQ